MDRNLAIQHFFDLNNNPYISFEITKIEEKFSYKNDIGFLIHFIEVRAGEAFQGKYFISESTLRNNRINKILNNGTNNN